MKKREFVTFKYPTNKTLITSLALTLSISHLTSTLVAHRIICH
jgi:hypothetical protein